MRLGNGEILSPPSSELWTEKSFEKSILIGPYSFAKSFSTAIGNNSNRILF